MENEKKAIVAKYRKNIERIIEKYKDNEDDSLEVIDILGMDSEPTFCIDSISFIKNRSMKTTATENFSLILFQDIYRMLCSECDFEDIYRILS